jgi:hypothetical protein
MIKLHEIDVFFKKKSIGALKFKMKLRNMKKKFKNPTLKSLKS